MTTRAPKEQTVAKTINDQTLEDQRPKAPEVTEAEANAKVAAEDKSAETKCDNHPGRQGRNFTGGGSYSINLCDECTPKWFKQD